MKRFFALLVTAVLIVSMLGVITAFAGASISGSSNVYAGSSYKYTGYVSYTGLDLVAKIEGLGETKAIKADSGNAENGSLKSNGYITVKIPSSAKPGDTYKITLSGSYSANDGSTKVAHTFSTSKTIKVVERPKSTGDSTPRAARATAAPTEWDITAASVQAMTSGGALTVDIKDDPKIPASLLSSVKEKQGALTVNFGSYTCTIDGKSLGSIPESVKTIDLSMKTDKDEAFTAAVGGKDAYQLHFAHKGQLPGKFSYTFKAGNNKPGDVLYLYYYYDQPGVCEGIQSATVDANGNVTFDIYHCSSYFVSASVIDGAAGVDFAAEDKNRQALQEAGDKQAELQTQLEEAQNSAQELQSQVDTLKSQGQPENNPLTASVAGPVEKLFGVPYGSLISALLGAALISMFFTMLFCRVGIFKKRTKGRTDIE